MDDTNTGYVMPFLALVIGLVLGALGAAFLNKQVEAIQSQQERQANHKKTT